jgi:autotransporter strand-loop-strand O-heptosyltransferase
MKVAQITPGLIQIPPNGWGAIEKIIWAYKLGLEKLGHEVEIKYSDHVSKDEFDIVHVHVANLAIDLEKRGIPYIFTMHDHHVEVYGKFSPCFQDNLKAIQGSVLSIVPAEHLIEYFGDLPNLKYLPHGVDVDFFKEIKREGAVEHKLLCVGKNGYGNDEKYDRKGFGLAIEAAKNLDLPITIAGPESNNTFFETIDTSYEKLDLVFNLTEEELKEQYALHTIFLHPSIVEAGHPNLTLLEAMSTGLPIVGTYSGTEFELDGIFKVERNAEQITEGIQKVIGDYSTYSQNAVRNARSLTWDYVTERLSSYYKNPNAITPEAEVFAESHVRIYKKVTKKPQSYLDKIFVINLKDRKDRKKRIAALLDKENIGVPTEFIDAIDIRELKKEEVQDWLSERGYGLYKWKTEKDDYLFDGYNFKEWDTRDLTKGEIGCSLSHYTVWKKAKEENHKRILVLEDDAFWHKTGDLPLAIKKIEECKAEFSLAYLGRTKITKSVEESIDAVFNYANFSYTTHAYVVDEKGIDSFLSQNLHQKIIPADEFFSACISDHRRPDIATAFPRVMKAITPKPGKCFVNQQGIDHQKESDVSDDRKIGVTFVDCPKVDITHQYVTNDKFKVDFILNNESVYNAELHDNTWAEVTLGRRVPWKIQVTDLRSGEDVFNHEYDDANQRVLVWFDSKSLGDNLAWMPHVERFRKISKSRVIVSTFWNELFRREYPEIEFIKPGSSAQNLYASYKIGCYDLESRDDHPIPWNKVPLSKICSDVLGIPYEEESARVNITDKKNRMDGQKYVCISTASTSGCKHWHGWQEVVDYLNSKGYKVVVIQKEPLDYMDLKPLNNVIFPNTAEKIEEAMAWLYNCEFYIGLSSGVSWLANALGKEVVMISGFTEPYNEFSCRRVINYNACYGCWHNHLFDKGNWKWCPEHEGTDRQFECMKTIKLEDIIEVMPLN